MTGISNLFRNVKLNVAMPGRKLTRHGFTLFILIILLLIIAFFVPFRLNLVIETRNNQLLHSWNIKAGDQFIITYRHSVNKTPVKEYFAIQKDAKLILTKTAFQSFGVGIPCELEPGEAMRHYPDHIEIVNINRELPQIFLAVGTIADHQITIHGDTVRLRDFSRPQQSVEIYIRRVSAYEMIRRGVSDREQ